jgi:WD40 repeat protein
MQYIVGQTLADFINKLSTASSVKDVESSEHYRRVASLGAQAAEALDHAHQMGIVHRDVKPANLILDARGNCWVTDFGLARSACDTKLTLTGDLVGTLRYLSPEQASSNRAVVDHRTDVYSLGATLYEMLTLQPAFAGRDRMEVLRQIAFEEPRALRRINKAIPEELETVVLKAMEKEPEARYANACELAEDLRRFLAHQPVNARRPTVVQRSAKWLRRHPGFLASAAAVGLIAFVLVSVSAWLIARERDRLDELRQVAEHNWQVAEHNWQLAESRGQVLSINEAAQRRGTLADNVNAGWQLWRVGRVQDTVRLLARHRPQANEEDLRTFEWFYLWRLCHSELATLHGDPTNVRHAILSPNGRLVATAGGDHTVRLWDTTGVQLVQRTQWQVLDPCWVSFSPDGQLLVTSGSDGIVWLWNVEDGSLRHTLRGFPGVTHDGVVSPDNELLASADIDGKVRLWSLANSKCLAVLPGHVDSPTCLGFSPDGRTFAAGEQNGKIHLWDVPTRTKKGQELGVGEPGNDVNALRFSNLGKMIAAGGMAQVARIWDVETGHCLQALASDQSVDRGSIHSVCFAPDDSHLAIGFDDGSVHAWDVNSGMRSQAVAPHQSRVFDMQWTAAQRLITASTNGTLKLLDLALPKYLGRWSCRVHALAVSPDGTFLVVGGDDGSLATIDLQSGKIHDRSQVHRNAVHEVAFAQSGRLLVSYTRGGLALAQEFAQGNLNAAQAQLSQSCTGLAISEDDTLLATTDRDRVHVWNSSNLERLASVAPAGGAMAVAFEDHEILVGCRNGAVRRCKWQTSAWTDATADHIHPIDRMHSRGNQYASGGTEYMVRLWSRTGGPVHTVSEADVSDGQYMALSPDGQTLALAVPTPTVRFVNAETGSTTLELPKQDGRITALTFTPDGTSLITATEQPGGTGVIRVWASQRTDP